MKHNRILLIEIGWYYPNGGISDVNASVDEYKEALEWFNERVKGTGIDRSTTYEVFDCDERKVVLKWSAEG